MKILEKDDWKYRRISELINRRNVPEKLALNAVRQGKVSCPKLAGYMYLCIDGISMCYVSSKVTVTFSFVNLNRGSIGAPEACCITVLVVHSGIAYH